MRALLLALVVVTSPCLAQSGLRVHAGVSRLAFDGDRVDRFDRTYSDFYAQRLEGDVDLLPSSLDVFALGAGWNFDLDGLSVGLDYTYGWGSSGAASEFENGSGDRVTLDVGEHVVGLDMLYYPVSQFGAGVVMTGTFRNLSLSSRTVYPDGVESLGGEYRLNGVYTASPASLEAGGVVRLAVGPVTVRGRYAVPLPGLSNTVSLPLTDYDLEQLNNGFPRDFSRWAADPTGSDEGAMLKDTDFVGARLDFGLEYTF